ncbi:MAG: radical SAM protein [Pseudomonadota bacterium]
MKIILLSLLPTTENFGIKYIHSYLLSKGHDSSVVFLPRHTEQALCAVTDFITAFKPDAVGCGVMTYEAPFAQRLGAAIKKKFPDLPFIAGGIHPTINPEECLEYADIVCVGESEEAIFDFAEAFDKKLDWRKINNLVYRDNGTVVKNPLRPLIEDLDALPFPGHLPEKAYICHGKRIVALSMDLFRRYTRYDGKAYNVISSRGCPFSCSYCCNSFLSRLYESKKIRKRSPGNVIQELKTVIDRFPDMILINIHDDCFLAQPADWHREFAEEYKKSIARPFIVRSTPLHLTEEKIALLKDAGLAWVTMGLQSGSENTNQNIFLRRVSNDKFLEATGLAKKYGVSGYYDVILDNPFESDQDVIETLHVLKRVPKPFQLQLFSLTFYKGTDIYTMFKEKFGPEAQPEVRNYFGYKRTFLNKLVRITPLIPETWVDYFISHRAKPGIRILFNCSYAFIALVLEPLSFFYLMLASFRNNLLLTLKIALPTFKTKIRERLFNF